MVLRFNHASNLDVFHSNYCWLCDSTRIDVLLSDTNSAVINHPYLTVVVDSYSDCILGFNLGFEQPSSQVVARALRHAILPKHYGSEYNLHFDWPTFGIPEHLYMDGGRNTNFDCLQIKASQIGIVLHQGLEVRQAGLVERCFLKFSKELFSHLPGYVKPNLRVIPEAMANQSCLTLEEVKKLLVQYIVSNYNQQIHPRLINQTRQQCWEGGLMSPPLLIQEQELDI